jgi:hypothetical protein
MEKEIVSQCAWHLPEHNKIGWMKDGVVIEDEAEIAEIERKVSEGIAVISHGICRKCALAIYPDICQEQ